MRRRRYGCRYVSVTALQFTHDQVIEYTLFQVGTFMEYIGFPRQTLKHVAVIPSVVNLESCRIIALEGHLDDPITFTSVEDIAAAVTGAIEYTGEWPVVGGISGDRISLRDVMKIGERITGSSYSKSCCFQDLQLTSYHLRGKVSSRPSARGRRQSWHLEHRSSAANCASLDPERASRDFQKRGYLWRFTEHGSRRLDCD